MNSAIRPDEAGYRRGVVLGLTMAEVMVLLLFCLLMTSLILFEEQRERIRQLEEERMPGGVTVPKEVADLIEEVSDVNVSGNVADEDFKVLVDVLEGLRNIKDMLKSLAPGQMEDDDGIAGAVDYVRGVMKAVRDVVEASGQSNKNADAINKGLENIRNGLTHLDEEGKRQFISRRPSSADRSKEALAKRLCEGEFEDPKLVEQCAKKVVDIAGGKGLEFKSCWWDKSVVPYATKVIYDVALTDEGFIVRDVDPLDAEYRNQKEQELPVSLVVPNVTIGESDFLSSTRPLYDWSVAHDCRFYVRVFDETLPTSKDVYKKRLAALEIHFYKQMTERQFYGAAGQ